VSSLRGAEVSRAAVPAWTRAQWLFFLATLAIGLGWSAFVCLTSQGWSLDDELSHYQRSRSVWDNPALIFDSWTRIGRNLFHVLPAHFGLTAARLWTLIFAGLSVVVTTLLAARLGVRRAWLIPLALCFQPWFVELSWGVLTQTPFLLALVTGVWALTGNRLVLSGLCFGLLPLIRHEGIALTGLWGVLIAVDSILKKRSLSHTLGAMLAAAAPTVAYNIAAWLAIGDLPARLFFVAKPTEIYGHGTLWHFIPISVQPAGMFTLALAAIGLPAIALRWKTAWPLVFYVAYFVLHSLIFWRGLFSSAGYYHFLMPLAPGLAVVMIFGADTLLDRSSRVLRALAGVLLTGALLQGFVLFHLWRDGRYSATLQRDPISYMIDEAFAWQKKHHPRALVVCHHTYAGFREDWRETPARRAFDTAPPDALPFGCFVFWEEKYADLTGLPLTTLQSDPAWVERQNFGRVRIFEKIR
jgi:hypothetical protein